jgi:predicted nucleotidyltransferase
MDGFDVADAKENLKRRREKRRREVRSLLARALEDRRKIIEMLIVRYKPLKIYVWGSLENTDLFTEHSDIDIAVEGLSGPLEGLHAQSEAEEMTEFSVDLVELERIHPVYAEDIRERGRLVYER